MSASPPFFRSRWVPRPDHVRELPLWTRLFTAFKVALDPKKLLLAAAGIVVMAFGWWLLANIFHWFEVNADARSRAAAPLSVSNA